MSVYFIQCGWSGPVKIGTASDPYGRLANLQTASPVPLWILGIIPGGYAVEAEMHIRFADVRLMGEWFRPDPGLVRFASQSQDDVEVEIPRGVRKKWRYVTAEDLHDMNVQFWARCRAGKMTDSMYSEWDTFYRRARTRLLTRPTCAA